MKKLLKLAAWKIDILEKWGFPLALLAARLHIGCLFWRSGMNKYTGLSAAVDLFKTEFIPNWEKNHVKEWLGVKISFPVPPADLAAHAACFSELVFGALVVVGLAGRAAAFGIFMMALTIQLFVYPEESDNLNWMCIMAFVIAAGPGKLSVDYFIRKKLLTADLYDKPVDVH